MSDTHVDASATLSDTARVHRGVQILGETRVGDTSVIGQHVILGHPSKSATACTAGLSGGAGCTIGVGCIIRSGTVVYERVRISDGVQTAHNAVIREDVIIGQGSVIGNNAVVREGAQLGRNVRVMDGALIAEGAVLGNDIFIGPNVTFTAGRHMLGAFEASGELTHDEVVEKEGEFWEGPSVIVGDRVRIGSNAVLLAGVRVGTGSVVAAGAVVSMDVPDGALAAGNPARLLKSGSGETKG